MTMREKLIGVPLLAWRLSSAFIPAHSAIHDTTINQQVEQSGGLGQRNVKDRNACIDQKSAVGPAQDYSLNNAN